MTSIISRTATACATQALRSTTFNGGSHISRIVFAHALRQSRPYRRSLSSWSAQRHEPLYRPKTRSAKKPKQPLLRSEMTTKERIAYNINRTGIDRATVACSFKGLLFLGYIFGMTYMAYSLWKEERQQQHQEEEMIRQIWEIRPGKGEVWLVTQQVRRPEPVPQTLSQWIEQKKDAPWYERLAKFFK